MRSAFLLAAAASAFLGGCSYPPVDVGLPDYYAGSQQSTELAGSRIAVEPIWDEREEAWSSQVGTRFDLYAAELAAVSETPIRSAVDVARWVTVALEEEVRRHGGSVVAASGEMVPFRSASAKIAAIGATDVDRIIVGRMRYLRWTAAGFAGFLVQPLLPTPVTQVELQLLVLDPAGRISWAGTTAAVWETPKRHPENADVGHAVHHAVNAALRGLFDDPSFLVALARSDGGAVP